MSLLVSMAIILHVVETWIPLPFVVPGAKLGLANVVALYTLSVWGLRSALTVSWLRAVLGSLVAGTFGTFAFILSLGGALVSTLVMGLVHRWGQQRFSLVGVSVVGAITHNLTQLLLVVWLLRQVGIMLLLPHMILLAVPTGIFTGLVVMKVRGLLGRHLHKWLA